MNDKPKATVIIPAYNAARTIGQTLASLLAQKGESLEIVVVDDGSTDETLDICYKIKASSPVPVRIFHQRHKRQSAARNFGLAQAKGEFVIFLDADDIPEREYVAKLVEAAEKDTETDISCCSYSLLYEDGATKPRRLPSSLAGNTLSGSEALSRILTEDIEVWSGSALYRRVFLLDSEVFFDEEMTMGEDIDFQWKAFYNARKVAFVTDILVHYVQHDLSVTRVFDPVHFPPATWLDPAGFLEYLGSKGKEDDRLRALVQERVMPRFLTRRLRNCILYGLDEMFWETLGQESTRTVLKRGFKKNFFSSPGIGLKCLSFLMLPGLVYRRYRYQRERLGG